MQQRWFTSYYEDETLAYHARPCQFVTLSRFSYALYTAIRLTSVYISLPLLVPSLPSSSLVALAPTLLPPLYFDRTLPFCTHLPDPAFFLYIKVTYVHLPPSISFSSSSTSVPPRLPNVGRKARVSRFVIARTHLSPLRFPRARREKEREYSSRIIIN